MANNMLNKKMIRDVRENKSSYFACIIIIAIGIMVYTAMSLAKDNLLLAKNNFYEWSNFADVFATVVSMPRSNIHNLQSIEGIESVQGRLVKEVKILNEDKSRNVVLKLVSIDIEKENEMINRIKIFDGNLPSNIDNNLLLEEKFFTANKLTMKDKLEAVVNGKKVEFKISGTGQSPEFIFVMRNGQDFAPDPLNFEAAFLSQEKMEELFNERGRVNSIVLSLKRGYNFSDVESKLKSQLSNYKVISLFERKYQTSNNMLSEELNQLSKMSTAIPSIFVFISCIIIYIMLKRLVEAQRGLIGIMMAFGYRKNEILLHYMSYGILIGSLGGIIGGLGGLWLANLMTKMYQQYYSLPNLVGRFSIFYFGVGIGASVVFCIMAAFFGSKKILKLKPADSLRPEVPEFRSSGIIESLKIIWNLFNVQGRMAIRNIVRNKSRSVFTLVGIMFSFSLMAFVFSQNSLMDTMIISQFTKVQKYDVKISLLKPMPSLNVKRELEQKSGVILSESLLEVPITLKKLHKKKDIIAIGIENNASLYNIFDREGNNAELSNDGMIISEHIARSLDIYVGDKLQVDCYMAKDSPFYVYVNKIIPQYLGANVYFERDFLCRLLGNVNIATSVMIKMDSDKIDKLRDEYNGTKYVGAFEIRQQTIEKYRKLMGGSAYALLIMAILSGFTGFAIVYNSSIISLAERKRELVSLRVLGMTPKEVLEVITVEQVIIGFLGILSGIPLAIMMNKAMAASLSSDLYSMPDSLDAWSVIQSIVGSIAFIWLAKKWIYKKIKVFDLVEVLKEREV
jgi:putative ABC transport system permease protein